ncbi:mechanosensitive ion channel family protein [Chitinimonas sp.]|uniref:mechanosensitive ion channel family protein n=1 Tax=Chitinimonas sp. TaxID=1934313 RepID=UPI002F958274
MQTLRTLLAQNDWEAWLAATCMLVASFAALLLFKRLLLGRVRRWASRTGCGLDDLLAEVVTATYSLVLLIVALHLGANQLVLPARLDTGLDRLLMVALLVQGGNWLIRGLLGWLRYKAQQGAGRNDAAMATHLALAGFLLRLVVWAVVLLSILANLGFNISALIASLGIGGVAVALAVQNILGDLFASMSIALDKPFVAGDAIVVDNISGMVKQVGLKTTRVQSDSGEEVVFANADLLKSRIRNYKRMNERRAVFSFGVAHGTPLEKLRRLPAILQEIVEQVPDARFDRAHLQALKPGSIDYEVAYYMLKPAYKVFVAAQEAINLALLERLAAEGIALATTGPVIELAGLLPAGQRLDGPAVRTDSAGTARPHAARA